MKTFTTKQELSNIIKSGYIGLVKHTESNFSLDILPIEKRGTYEWKFDRSAYKGYRKFKPFTAEQNEKVITKRSNRVEHSPMRLWK